MLLLPRSSITQTRTGSLDGLAEKTPNELPRHLMA